VALNEVFADFDPLAPENSEGAMCKRSVTMSPTSFARRSAARLNNKLSLCRW
jgi:hypothetical protein